MKEHVVFDIEREKYKYLQRDVVTRKVDMIDLNKKLNHTKKINFYNNTKIIVFLLLCLSVFVLISLKA
tara:strand:- start:266 stop:469 length:204 start_codon:yes stop_codon:yes gene_type:complete